MSMCDLGRHRTTRPAPGAGTCRIRGFTLIELMIVVAVVAILAAIAYPSYEQHVRKTYRADAKADLMELASFMERYYTENSTYVGADITTVFTSTPQPAQTPHSGTARYLHTFSVGPTATTFKLTATAQSLGGQDQDPCRDMTIDQTGAKTPTTGTDGRNCW